MAHEVFISFSTKDKPTADAVCAVLEARGIRCWMAPRDVLPGVDWGEAIIDAINETAIMVLVLSRNANESVQLKREVERAVHKGTIIIPFRIEDVPLSKALEYHISTTHWLDALTPPLESHLAHLADRIEGLLKRTPNNRETLITCRHCGSKTSRKTKFCGECGRSLTGAPPKPSVPQPEPPLFNSPPKKTSLATPITVVVSLLAVAIAAVAFFNSGSNLPKNGPTPVTTSTAFTPTPTPSLSPKATNADATKNATPESTPSPPGASNVEPEESTSPASNSNRTVVSNPPTEPPPAQTSQPDASAVRGVMRLKFEMPVESHECLLQLNGTSASMRSFIQGKADGSRLVVDQMMTPIVTPQGLFYKGSNPMFAGTNTAVPGYAPDNLLFAPQPNGTWNVAVCDDRQVCAPVYVVSFERSP